MVTHVHPAYPWFTCRTRSSVVAAASDSVFGASHEYPPSAQSPFARLGCYPSRRDIAYHVDGRYPVFIAHTDSCARPKGSYRLRFPLLQQVFAGCRHSLLPLGPSRRYLCQSLLDSQPCRLLRHPSFKTLSIFDSLMCSDRPAIITIAYRTLQLRCSCTTPS